MAAGIAVVEALKKTGGDTNTNKLIAAMEGMSLRRLGHDDLPQGSTTRRCRTMYHFKIKVDLAFAWGVPELVREIKASEMDGSAIRKGQAG